MDHLVLYAPSIMTPPGSKSTVLQEVTHRRSNPRVPLEVPVIQSMKRLQQTPDLHRLQMQVPPPAPLATSSGPSLMPINLRGGYVRAKSWVVNHWPPSAGFARSQAAPVSISTTSGASHAPHVVKQTSTATVSEEQNDDRENIVAPYQKDPVNAKLQDKEEQTNNNSSINVHPVINPTLGPAPTNAENTGEKSVPLPPTLDVIEPFGGLKSPDLDAVLMREFPGAIDRPSNDKAYDTTKPTCSLNLVCYSRGCKMSQISVTTPARFASKQEFKTELAANEKLLVTDKQLFQELQRLYMSKIAVLPGTTFNTRAPVRIHHGRGPVRIQSPRLLHDRDRMVGTYAFVTLSTKLTWVWRDAQTAFTVATFILTVATVFYNCKIGEKILVSYYSRS
ncbi:hypothetical protein EJ04DRAFT_523014 [Polyplosphaeria fusca]|uniref:Uncharacterized protein n=1 Tax=Polyplosphaeria fusca TaxID=682080 RepID=A0A9P4QYK3_9PLEO|nr:hypothetical protein EJ04DRAFT_523014 [Polyplosphaeria fusca]